MRYLVLLIAFFIVGCAETAEQRAERLAKYQQQCVEYGFTRGTADFAACVLKLDLQDQQKRAAFAQAIGKSFQQLGQDIQREQMQLERMRPLSCTTQVIGGIAHTTCH